MSNNQDESFQLVCNEQIFCARQEHNAKMAILIEQQEMNLISILKPEIVLRDKWYVILNKDLFGEGDTPMEAIYDFNKQFNKKHERNSK